MVDIGWDGRKNATGADRRVVRRYPTVERRSAEHNSRIFFSSGRNDSERHRLADEQRDRIDDILSTLLADDEDEDDFLDLSSPEAIERERTRWHIHDELNAHRVRS